MEMQAVRGEGGLRLMRGIRLTSAVRWTRGVSASVKWYAVFGGLSARMKKIRSMRRETGWY